MKRLLYLLFTCISVAGLSQPPVVWTTSKNWKIYYVTKRSGFAYSLDTLQFIKQISLNTDTLQQFLQTAKEIPTDRQPVFMGYYVASCELSDATVIKIEISQYGAFFYDDRHKKYYNLADDLERDWLAYLTAKWRQLQETIVH